MDCLFCNIVKGKEKSRKIYEDDLVIAILDVHPDADGHTLIIPKKHYHDYKDLDQEIIMHMYKVADILCTKLMEKLNSTGFAFMINYGDRQFIKHFHMHLLPDYKKNKATKNIDEIYEILTK